MIIGTLSGRMTADPIVRQGNNGNFTTFSVAVNHGKKDGVEQTTFVDCTANGKTGELVAEHFRKSDVFSGPAEFRIREYESNGQKKQQLSATVSMIDWVASQTKPKEQPAPQAPAQQYGVPPQYQPQQPAGYPPQQQYQQPQQQQQYQAQAPAPQQQYPPQQQYTAPAPAPQQYVQAPQYAPQPAPQYAPQQHPQGYPAQAPQQTGLPMGNGGGRSPF